MHALVASHDGIGGACVDTQGATNTPVFLNENGLAWCFQAKVRIQSSCGFTGDTGQTGNTLLTTRRALIDVGFTRVNGTAVTCTVWIAATCALRLG
jgi:hypothetical protein